MCLVTTKVVLRADEVAFYRSVCVPACGELGSGPVEDDMIGAELDVRGVDWSGLVWSS